MKLIRQLQAQLLEAETNLQRLRRSLTNSLLREGKEELSAFSEKLNSVSQVLGQTRQQLGPVLHADHDLADHEVAIWQALGSRTEADLTDLFVELRQKDKDLSLGELLKILESLYRKNRLSIRIRPRG